jgi:hypothetical protein
MTVMASTPMTGSARLSAIAEAAERIKKELHIDDEVVVLGLDGFEELRHRPAARTAILYAFDPIDQPFPPQGRAGCLLRDVEAGILLNEHVAEDGPTVFAHACQLGAEGIVSIYRSTFVEFEGKMAISSPPDSVHGFLHCGSERSRRPLTVCFGPSRGIIRSA